MNNTTNTSLNIQCKKSAIEILELLDTAGFTVDSEKCYDYEEMVNSITSLIENNLNNNNYYE